MFIGKINLEEYGIIKNDNGWYTSSNFMDKTIENGSYVWLNQCKYSFNALKKRSSNLYHAHRSVKDSPRRGIAVKRRQLIKPCNWYQFLVDTFMKMGDEIKSKGVDEHSIMNINYEHEKFQCRKIGYFSPYVVGSLQKSTINHINEAKEFNDAKLSVDDQNIVLKAIEKLKEDISSIPDLSLKPVAEVDAMFDANIQGLAGGVIQMSRDTVFEQRESIEANNKRIPVSEKFRTKEYLKQLSRMYNVNLMGCRSAAEVILKLAKSENNPMVQSFNAWQNVITILERIQVGGVDWHDPNERKELDWSDFKPAKVRQIMSNDPVYQVFDSQSGQSFREACVSKQLRFYNTLFEPRTRYNAVKSILKEARKLNATVFPIDFKGHDAKLKAEMMINILQHVVKPKFSTEYQNYIDLACLTLVFKVVAVPTASGFRLVNLYGSLGSGHPWTNIIGTLGTRLVSAILSILFPDIVVFSPGCNNGDDSGICILLNAIAEYGLDNILKVFNDALYRFGYVINEDKNIVIPTNAKGELAFHWEQYVYYLDDLGDLVKLGSCMRYFGKVYVQERESSRVHADEGVLDQLSIMNNCIGRTEGMNRITFSGLFCYLLATVIDLDPFFRSIVDDNRGASFFKALCMIGVNRIQQSLRDEQASQAKGIYLDKLGYSYDKQDWKATINQAITSSKVSLNYPIVQLVGLGRKKLFELGSSLCTMYSAYVNDRGDCYNIKRIY